jgi:hypothetical protein
MVCLRRELNEAQGSGQAETPRKQEEDEQQAFQIAAKLDFPGNRYSSKIEFQANRVSGKVEMRKVVVEQN